MSIQNEPTPESERIVVDEIIDGAKTWPDARLLRAKRLEGQPADDLGIHTWGDEREDCISVWRVEAFAGFAGPRKLREGDVFFVKDGSELTGKYTPIEREKAAREHLLVHWDESRRLARVEIKKQFAALTAVQIAGKDSQKVEKLVSEAEKKIQDDR